jgi:hypothetical protein
MTTQRKVFIQSQDTPTSATKLYQAVNCTAQIDKLTATNTTATAQTVSVYLVPSGGSVLSSNLVAKSVTIGAGLSYLFPEITGHDLANGDAIWGIASASGVTIRAGGRETTS